MKHISFLCGDNAVQDFLLDTVQNLMFSLSIYNTQTNI